jgi:hypothetical protein
MPAVSEKQRKLFGIALAMKQGETPYSYSKEAAELARTMSEDELRKYAGHVEKPKKKRYGFVGK